MLLWLSPLLLLMNPYAAVENRYHLAAWPGEQHPVRSPGQVDPLAFVGWDDAVSPQQGALAVLPLTFMWHGLARRLLWPPPLLLLLPVAVLVLGAPPGELTPTPGPATRRICPTLSSCLPSHPTTPTSQPQPHPHTHLLKFRNSITSTFPLHANAPPTSVPTPSPTSVPTPIPSRLTSSSSHLPHPSRSWVASLFLCIFTQRDDCLFESIGRVTSSPPGECFNLTTDGNCQATPLRDYSEVDTHARLYNRSGGEFAATLHLGTDCDQSFPTPVAV